ncbi:PREDICTED: butyrophilin-like protein 8 [Chinchilla lanigera]|uniref:butyrophilin-like protein 8 n=1 Tax=Chinchilla lanigera TaxID=34839 RepID=UPI0006980D67|nr:PREDICTED: butyrophilin-like protein 8 [Chinchilla lanigera]
MITGQWQVSGPDKPVQSLLGKDTVFSCYLSPETNVETMEVRFFKDQFSAVVHLYRDGEDQKYMQEPAYRRRTVLVKDFMADGHVSLAMRNITLSDAGLYGCWFCSQSYHQVAPWELQVLGQFLAPEIS